MTAPGHSSALAGWQLRDMVIASAALLLGAIVPFTLAVISPTNRRLLDPALDSRGPMAAVLLQRWSRLHAVRSVLVGVAFSMFVVRSASFRAASHQNGSALEPADISHCAEGERRWTKTLRTWIERRL